MTRIHYGVAHEAGKWSVIGAEHLHRAPDEPAETYRARYESVIIAQPAIRAGSTTTDIRDLVVSLLKKAFTPPEYIQPKFYIDASGNGGALVDLLNIERAEHRFPPRSSFPVGIAAGKPSAPYLQLDLQWLLNRVVTAEGAGTLKFAPRLEGLEPLVKSLEGLKEEDAAKAISANPVVLALALAIHHPGAGQPPRYRERDGSISFHWTVSPDPYLRNR